MALSEGDVREILDFIDAAPNGEIRVQTEGFYLHVVKGEGTAPMMASVPAPPAALAPAPPAVLAPAPAAPATALTAPAAAAPAPASAAPAPAAAPSPAAAPAAAAPAVAAAGAGAPQDGLDTIESPMLGTFYRAEAPGEAPFVEVGSVIEPETVVCIIEVMKMMNSVQAGIAGKIVEICADNAALVEYGAPLFRVEAV